MRPAHESLVFSLVTDARRKRGLAGHANATDWIRETLHEQAVALGVDLPPEYNIVRQVRAVNMGGPASSGEGQQCSAPGCGNGAGECGPLCDGHVDELTRGGLGAHLPAWALPG